MRPHFPREYIASSRSLLSSSILIRALNERGEKKPRVLLGYYRPRETVKLFPTARMTTSFDTFIHFSAMGGAGV